MRPIKTPLLLSLLLMGGCAVIPVLQPGGQPVTYDAAPSPVRLEGSAVVEATYDVDPQLMETWKRSWGNKTIDSHHAEVVNALLKDFSGSGVFGQVLPAGTPTDYVAHVRARILRSGNELRLRITLRILRAGSQEELWNLWHEGPLGPMAGPNPPLGILLKGVTHAVKADLATAMQQKARADAEAREIADLKGATLDGLLVATDRNPMIARERNRAIIAYKNEKLPELLRTARTSELSALVIKVEQTILDLNHEIEVAKDKAQRSVAEGKDETNQQIAARTDRMAARMGAPANSAPRGFIGIQLTDVGGTPGTMVKSVVPGSPASRTDLKAGEVITGINGQLVADSAAALNVIRQLPPGTTANFGVHSATGVVRRVSVVVGEPPVQTAPDAFSNLRDLSISHRERIELLKPIVNALKEEVINRNR